MKLWDKKNHIAIVYILQSVDEEHMLYIVD